MDLQQGADLQWEITQEYWMVFLCISTGEEKIVRASVVENMYVKFSL